MSVIELPFGLPGRIFRSPMPYGPYDPQGIVLGRFRQEQIAVIMLLASDEECIYKAGRHLRMLYQQEGWQVLYLPIPDFGVPAKADLERGVQSTIELARTGQHIAVHCSAGIGRTGLFTACLAKHVLGLSGEDAIAWIRRYIPGAVETSIQKQLVMGHDPA
jgi:hypothetical protein